MLQDKQSLKKQLKLITLLSSEWTGSNLYPIKDKRREVAQYFQQDMQAFSIAGIDKKKKKNEVPEEVLLANHPFSQVLDFIRK